MSKLHIVSFIAIIMACGICATAQSSSFKPTRYANDNTFSISDTIRFADTRPDSQTGYVSWTGVMKYSKAVYAGRSGDANSSIQLRENYADCGIFTPISGGTLTAIEVEWNQTTNPNRTLNIYGKDTPYSSPAELYDPSTAGTLIGTIVNGQSASLSVSDQYKYVGIRSNEYVCYLNSIIFTWEGAPRDLNMKMGDVNSDTDVDISDVVTLANFVMGENPEKFNSDAADVNFDTEINIGDVVALANQVLGN